MKKIINGKVYDTSTAQFIYCWDDNLPHNDLDHSEDSLYRKKTGEYFLYGCGGARSGFAKCTGNTSSSGDRFLPLSYDDAVDWAQNHMPSEKYEQHFGEITEDENFICTTFYLSSANVEKLRRKSSETGKKMSAIVNGMIENI